jgi:hypothetical protein
MEEGEMQAPSLWLLRVSLQAYHLFFLLFLMDWGDVMTIGLGDSAMTRNVKSFNYKEQNFTQG